MIRQLRHVAVAIASLAATGTPASAQGNAARAWVASTGSNANPCTREQPCRTFAYAVTRIRDGGEIDCVDSAEYGPIQTQRSLTIDCRGATGRILQEATNQVRPAVRVGGPAVLRGLIITGVPNADLFSHGIEAGGDLTLDEVTVQDITCGQCFGLAYSGTNLTVTNSNFLRNGNASSVSGGISVSTNNYSTATFDRVRIQENRNVGLNIRAVGNTTSANLVVSGSQFIATDVGIAMTSSNNAPVALTVKDTQLLHNSIVGLRISGPQAVARVFDSVIAGNTLGITGTDGATLGSYGGNLLASNVTNGTFSGTGGKN